MQQGNCVFIVLITCLFVFRLLCVCGRCAPCGCSAVCTERGAMRVCVSCLVCRSLRCVCGCPGRPPSCLSSRAEPAGAQQPTQRCEQPHPATTRGGRRTSRRERERERAKGAAQRHTQA